MKCKMGCVALATAMVICVVTQTGFAAEYVWTDGYYKQSTVNPQIPVDLLAEDVLYIAAKSNTNNNPYDPYEGLKFVDCGPLNNRGTIVWDDNGWDLYLTSGPAYGRTVITNQGVFEARVDRAMVYGGGWGDNTFLNDVGGTFRKSAGTGTTAFASSSSAWNEFIFINRGTLDAQVGTILYGGPISHFENGTLFTGAGTHRIAAVYNTDFTGSMTAAPETMVIFDASYYGSLYSMFVGIGAVIHGNFNLQLGTLKGTWTIAGDGLLNTMTDGGKNVTNADVINWGIFRISQGGIGFDSSTFTNHGVIEFADDSDFYYGGDGVPPTLTNFGTLRKKSGTGISSLGISNWSQINFSTAPGSVIEVQSGTAAIMSRAFTQNTGTIHVHQHTSFQGLWNLTNVGTIRGGGTVEITGENKRLINEGQVHPGDTTGTLAIDNAFQQNAAGHLNIEIAGAAVGQHDVLSVVGDAVLGGTVDFWRLPGYNPQAGDTFEFLTAGGSLSGTFDVVYHGFDGVTFGDIVYGDHGVSMTVTAVDHLPRLLGDLDHNDKVDLVDFALFAPHWLSFDCGSCGGADLTGDSAVTLDDLFRFVQTWLSEND